MLSTMQVESAMSRIMHACAPTDSVLYAMDVMSTRQVRRVPIVNEKGRLAGIVAIADIARYVQSLPRQGRRRVRAARHDLERHLGEAW